MNGRLHFLQPKEHAAVNECAARLHVALGAGLIGLWLFGSKSRGDYGPDSDIDLLVVLDDLQPDKRWRIRQIAARCSLEYDVLFNTHILDQARWEEEVHYRSTLWREIQRDGVSLMPAAVSPKE
jgi:predicted nucleotidyltransferase